MENYMKRRVENLLTEALEEFPVVMVSGPREAGKTSLLKNLLSKDYQYVSFEDPLKIDKFESDPHGFFKEFSGTHIFFDEVQHVPGLTEYLHINANTRYVLAGSHSLENFPEKAPHLAGKCYNITILPPQLVEIPGKKSHLQKLKGSFPALIQHHYIDWTEWYASYLLHYLEAKAGCHFNNDHRADFRHFIQLLAANIAKELNASVLAKEIGVDVKTIQKWITLLEKDHLIFLVPSYHDDLGKRIVKRPKLYFIDTGLVCYLTGISDISALEKGPMGGPIFENYIAVEIYKNICHTGSEGKLYYYRDNHNLESDLIIEDSLTDSVNFITIRHTATAREKMVEDITKLMDLKKSREELHHVEGTLLYQGSNETLEQKNISIKNYLSYLDFN